RRTQSKKGWYLKKHKIDEELDTQFELYNEIVKAFNEYLEEIGRFKAEKKKRLYTSSHSTHKQETQNKGQSKNESKEEEEEELRQLQELLGEQTILLKDQMKKNKELETSLQSVLSDYSTKINSSNRQIKDLHQQLAQQNAIHQKQVQQLNTTYEQQLLTLKKSKDEAYKKEMGELIQTLSDVRRQFRSQIEELTKQMQSNQSNHEVEVLKLSGTIQELNADLEGVRTSLQRLARINDALMAQRAKHKYLTEKQWNRQKFQNFRTSLVSVKTTADVDEENYNNNNNNNDNNNNNNDNNNNNHQHSASQYIQGRTSGKYRVGETSSVTSTPTQYFRRGEETPLVNSNEDLGASFPNRHNRKESGVSTTSSTSSIAQQSGGKYYKRGDPLPRGVAQSSGNSKMAPIDEFSAPLIVYDASPVSKSISSSPQVHTDTTMGSTAFAGGSSKNRRRQELLQQRNLNAVGQIESIDSKSAVSSTGNDQKLNKASQMNATDPPKSNNEMPIVPKVISGTKEKLVPRYYDTDEDDVDINDSDDDSEDNHAENYINSRSKNQHTSADNDKASKNVKQQNTTHELKDRVQNDDKNANYSRNRSANIHGNKNENLPVTEKKAADLADTDNSGQKNIVSNDNTNSQETGARRLKSTTSSHALTKYKQLKKDNKLVSDYAPMTGPDNAGNTSSVTSEPNSNSGDADTQKSPKRQNTFKKLFFGKKDKQ
ncbi:hypothetical protein RFI_16184, partial [Reticulomyxa filosa]